MVRVVRTRLCLFWVYLFMVTAYFGRLPFLMLWAVGIPVCSICTVHLPPYFSLCSATLICKMVTSAPAAGPPLMPSFSFSFGSPISTIPVLRCEYVLVSKTTK